MSNTLENVSVVPCSEGQVELALQNHNGNYQISLDPRNLSVEYKCWLHT
jgi:hypothetical protein